MTPKEIAALGFAAFWVLMIVFIVFASKNKKLKSLAKQNVKKQELTNKHYPSLQFVINLISSWFLFVEYHRMILAYEVTNIYVMFVGILLIVLMVWKLQKFISQKAKQREAEGHESRHDEQKLIRRFYPLNLYRGIVFLPVYFCAVNLEDLALGFVPVFSFAFSVIMPIDYWIHEKLLEKSKLLEEKTK